MKHTLQTKITLSLLLLFFGNFSAYAINVNVWGVFAACVTVNDAWMNPRSTTLVISKYSFQLDAGMISDDFDPEKKWESDRYKYHKKKN